MENTEQNNSSYLLFVVAFIVVLLVGLSVVNRMSDKSDNLAPVAETVEELDQTAESLDNDPMNETQNSDLPEMILEDGVNYSARIKTNMGEVVVDLYETDSPITVNNFVSLAKDGFYDGVIFHRVIKDFMIQGGDPTGTGSGGPGYTFQDEINERPLVQGSLAMANAGPGPRGEGTNGSQFFIVTAESTPWLDGLHTNFGEVTEGMDVVMSIQDVKTAVADKPVEDVVIETVEIIEQ